MPWSQSPDRRGIRPHEEYVNKKKLVRLQSQSPDRRGIRPHQPTGGEIAAGECMSQSPDRRGIRPHWDGRQGRLRDRAQVSIP